MECLRDCFGCCCHDVGFRDITQGQAQLMRQAGGKITRVVFEPGVYLIGPCPYWQKDTHACGVFQEKSLRPGDCYRLEAGSQSCLEFRNAQVKLV